MLVLKGKDGKLLWTHKIGSDFKDRTIYTLYVNEKAVIKRENETYEEAKIQKRYETKMQFIAHKSCYLI